MGPAGSGTASGASSSGWRGAAYKMHVRVLLSRYRSYDPCPACNGARLKDEALDWRLGSVADADAALDAGAALPARPDQCRSPDLARPCQGSTSTTSWACPSPAAATSSTALRLGGGLDQALDLLLTGIRQRLRYLCEVGLSYLTLDRQSRTLSGGEVQRINLTTALGTALVNTLFVLDEPSIGLHPRDMDRIVGLLPPPARRRQLAAGRGARPAGHAGRGPHPRPGSRPR